VSISGIIISSATFILLFFVQRGFYGEDVIYTHRVSINPNIDLNPIEDLWYFRVFVQDDVNPVTEIPTDNGIYYIKNYMSFEKIN